MTSRYPTRLTARRCTDQRGFSLLEVLVASFLLIIVFFGLAQLHARGRRQIDYEEDRRKATGVLQSRLDGIRRDYTFDTLPSLNGTILSLAVDSRPYTIAHVVTPDDSLQMDTVRLAVTWQARTSGGATVNRTMTASTLLARGMP
jgi:prepilin-type N-terminal cleavage/methylation domain-containing protein